MISEEMKRRAPASDFEAAKCSRRRTETYFDKLESLESDLNDNAEDREEQQESLDRFSDQYLLPPLQWDTRIQLEENPDYETYKVLTKRALSDFYSQSLFYIDPAFPQLKEEFEKEEKPFDRLMEWQYWTKMTDDCIQQAGIQDVEPMLKEALSFPHSQLQEVCWYYEEFSGTPMTEKLRHQLLANKQLYKKIKELEESPSAKEWFKAVTTTNDLRYIVQNVEARIAREIGEQIDDKKLKLELWHMYIKYLLTKDRMLAEDVYYRFRRIFLYHRTFASEFPQFRGTLSKDAKNAMERMKFNSPYKFTQLPSAPITIYSNEKWIKQTFPFRESLMHYIFKNAHFKVTKKLYVSCKHLYFLQRKAVLHSLYVGNDLKLQYFRNSMATDGEASEFLEMDKLIVTNTLIVQHSEKTNLMHSISPKFAACNLRFLRITNQSFFVNEYNFLTEAGRIMKLVFQKVTIKEENGEPIILENFLYNLPQAMYIDAPIKTRTTPETEKLLFTWNKPQKIHCISILLDDELMEILRPMRLFKFLSRLVVNVKKSTNVVQFEKGNENISNYLQDLIASTAIWKNTHEGTAPPKVLTLKDYENLL